VLVIEMPKRLKAFACKSILTALYLGVAYAAYTKIGPFVAGDYFTLILWSIRLAMVAVLAFIFWRLCVGLKDGDLYRDD